MYLSGMKCKPLFRYIDQVRRALGAVSCSLDRRWVWTIADEFSSGSMLKVAARCCFSVVFFQTRSVPIFSQLPKFGWATTKREARGLDEQATENKTKIEKRNSEKTRVWKWASQEMVSVLGIVCKELCLLQFSQGVADGLSSTGVFSASRTVD